MKRFRGGLITLIASATTNQAGAHAADVTPRCIGFFVHFFQRRTVLLLQGKKIMSTTFFPRVPFQFHEIGGKIPGGFCGTKVNTDLVSKTPSRAVFPFLDMNIITTKHTFYDINCTKQRIPMKKRGQKFQGLSSVFEFMTAAPNKTWQPAGAVFGQLIFHISKSDFRYVPILNRVLAPCQVDTGE